MTACVSTCGPPSAPFTMKRTRLDLFLVERGLCESRAKAQALIMAGRVLVDGERAEKAGAAVTPDQSVTISELEHPYVGRGGMKLARAVEVFGIELTDRVCIDVGASTGGFTDVMLRAGARSVYAVDVGHGQLDAKLRTDPRVIVRERLNARFLDPAEFDPRPSFASIDVSFISLRLILEPVLAVLEEPAELVALIKPQFEVGKRDVGKGGIVRDENARAAAVAAVVEYARSLGPEVSEPIESPVRGAEGNVEYLMYARVAGRG